MNAVLLLGRFPRANDASRQEGKDDRGEHELQPAGYDDLDVHGAHSTAVFV